MNVRSVLWHYTLDAKLQQEPEWTDYRAILDTAVDQYNRMKTVGGPSLGQAQRDLTTAKRAFETVERRCTQDILMKAEVIVSTCIGAGTDTLRSFADMENVEFRTVLIDEAAQCMESATLPTLMYGCERLVLIGDQNQLPPVVTSPSALQYGLGAPLIIFLPDYSVSNTQFYQFFCLIPPL